MKKYYLVENNQQTGPLSKEELRGRVSPSSLVWTEGMSDWTQAASLLELSDLFRSTPPPVFTDPSGGNGEVHYQSATKTILQKPYKGKSAVGLILFAYLLALLGGAGGIVLGSVLWMAKTEISGVKKKKYSQAGQIHGAIAFFLGIFVWAIFVVAMTK